ncbi:Os06g0117700 [Oryza sativa Japonica Group]|uniref:Os06g0117700 protein n=1 Tax=Oryza sativa subsp. japonica TaxID=39947 RepID=A0A0P0WRX0_ORYSJ|nr:Os06g0117700 [Oryza sativa Japonica Group]
MRRDAPLARVRAAAAKSMSRERRDGTGDEGGWVGERSIPAKSSSEQISSAAELSLSPGPGKVANLIYSAVPTAASYSTFPAVPTAAAVTTAEAAVPAAATVTPAATFPAEAADPAATTVPAAATDTVGAAIPSGATLAADTAGATLLGRHLGEPQSGRQRLHCRRGHHGLRDRALLVGRAHQVGQARRVGRPPELAGMAALDRSA